MTITFVCPRGRRNRRTVSARSTKIRCSCGCGYVYTVTFR